MSDPAAKTKPVPDPSPRPGLRPVGDLDKLQAVVDHYTRRENDAKIDVFMNRVRPRRG